MNIKILLWWTLKTSFQHRDSPWFHLYSSSASLVLVRLARHSQSQPTQKSKPNKFKFALVINFEQANNIFFSTVCHIIGSSVFKQDNFCKRSLSEKHMVYWDDGHCWTTGGSGESRPSINHNFLLIHVHMQRLKRMNLHFKFPKNYLRVPYIYMHGTCNLIQHWAVHPSQNALQYVLCCWTYLDVKTGNKSWINNRLIGFAFFCTFKGD